MLSIRFCSLILIFLFAFPLITKASGIFSPNVSTKQAVDKGDLKWYSILKSLNIQKEQAELKQRWNAYWEKLNQYAKSHLEVSPAILKEMRYGHVINGMKEEQVILIAEPNSIDIFDNGKLKILFYETNLVTKDRWIKTWVTIKNGEVINIKEQTSTYGW